MNGTTKAARDRLQSTYGEKAKTDPAVAHLLTHLLHQMERYDSLYAMNEELRAEAKKAGKRA